MDEHSHHDELIKSLTKEYQDILTNSEQAVYLYLDDMHKTCNKKFATLLGYSSEDEWAQIDTPFPEVFVANESQDTLVSAYLNAMNKHIGSTNKIVWKKKDGSTVDTTVILVPISHEGHFFALHYITT